MLKSVETEHTGQLFALDAWRWFDWGGRIKWAWRKINWKGDNDEGYAWLWRDSKHLSLVVSTIRGRNEKRGAGGTDVDIESEDNQLSGQWNEHYLKETVLWMSKNWSDMNILI